MGSYLGMTPLQLVHGEKILLVQNMQVSDLAEVLAIEAEAQAHPWSKKKFLSSIESTHHCYVLKFQQYIVAYGVTSTAADEAELLTITVKPNHQKQGYGRLFLEFLCASFDESIHTFFLEVRASNQGAIALYDQLLFNEVGLRPNYYPSANGSGEREDAIIMAKSL